MKSFLLILTIYLAGFTGQDARLPIYAYKGRDSTSPLLFYVSGDGGINNSFSASFMKRFNDEGYSIIGLDSRSYFWVQKKPQEAADEISNVLAQYLKQWNCKGLVLIGYSFGADVMPFIQRRLQRNIYLLNKHLVLMSPAKKTDFTIHVLSMFGVDTNKGESVPDEINKLLIPTTLIFGETENDFPLHAITTKNVQTIKLPGGHHYNRNIGELVKQITNRINRP
jgi:type IV secretory pathway VirJ component